MKKYKNGQFIKKGIDFTNWRIWVIVATIIWCVVVSGYSNNENYTYVREPEVFMVPVVVEQEPRIEDKIKEYFPRSWKTVIAIAHAESNMKPTAINHNCFYKGSVVFTERVKGSISTFCKDGHEKYAWSVDCGILQVNVKGQTCPEWTLDEHLEIASELSKRQGLEAWVAYKNGAYKKYLAKN